MPGTSRSFLRRLSTTCFIGGRSARGFRLMNMRPVFCEPPAPPAPLKELTVNTAGSALSTSATRFCKATMAGNDVSSAASVEMLIWPMSSSGKDRLGMVKQSHALLDMAHDVFEHDDRVVDDEANGQRQAEQRDVVDRVAEGPEQRDGAD